MSGFVIAKPTSFAQAADLVAEQRYALPILKAGGMDVVDHLKEGLVEPDALIDVRLLRSGAPGRIAFGGGNAEFHIDANVTLAELGDSTLLRDNAAILAHAAASAATPQVRNVATTAGNLLQRPRCWYYRNATFDCLKKGGSTCYAVDGENEYHAIFGGGPCHIVHPSNIALALHVLDATVHTVRSGGATRGVPMDALYHLPDRGVRDEHDLEADEVVTHITFPKPTATAFYAVKHKQSFDWPLVMAGVMLDLDGSRIRSARVCAGAVAPVPWPLPRIAEALVGVDTADDDAVTAACSGAADGATPMRDNAYKARLLPVAVKRAVLRAAGRETP